MVTHSRRSGAAPADASTVRAAIYTRISRDKTGEKLGVTRQLEGCVQLAERLGWPVDMDAHHFEDNDISATTGVARPRFDALLAAIKRGEINAVICWQPDRLYRSISDLSRLLELGVQIHTVNGGALDLSNANGRMLATILGAAATGESEVKVERQLAAARQKAQLGKPHWKAAFGYITDTRPKTQDDGTREPDPVTAKLVADAYRQIVDTREAKITAIAKQWNAVGAVPASGVAWTPSTLSQFLRDPRNAALRTHNGEVVLNEAGDPVKGTWQPLVDESIWRRAQSVLNAPGRAPGVKSVQRHLLTGLLRCGKPGCGHYLSGTQTLDRKRIAYACKQCRGVSIRAEHVEPLIFWLVAGALSDPDVVARLMRLLCTDGADDAEKLVLLGRLDQLIDERADGLYDGRGDEYHRTVARINEKLAVIANRERANRERDSEKASVLRDLRDLPLGTPEVVDDIWKLSKSHHGLYRDLITMLMTPTVAPIGKGGRVFNRDRVDPGWRV